MNFLTDHQAITALVAEFFTAFTTGPDLDARMERLRECFHPGAVVTRLEPYPIADPRVDDVEGFIRPRHELLASGRYDSFRETPESGRVEINGDLAQWFGTYTKTWTDEAGAHHGRGVKALQLLRTPAGWRIHALAWQDS